MEVCERLADELLVLGMGGTIDKDYPRTTNGYAFEIDEPAAGRVLAELPFLALEFRAESVCRKDSTEIGDADRDLLVEVVRASSAARVVVTHGTDTLIETARYVLASGVASSRRIAFTGAMKPERFKDSDASFNLGAAVAATELQQKGSVVVCMGGRVLDCTDCERDTTTGLFVDARRAKAPS